MTGHPFNIIIIGGGAAASAAALTFLQAGETSIYIIERSDFSEQRIGETIPPDTNYFLHELGVQNAFASQKHLPCYGSRSLWGSPRLGHNDFLTSPYGNGWHLNRVMFDKMLLEQAVAKGANRITGHCTSVETEEDKITSVRVNGTQIMANWYLDATGREAILSRAGGAKRIFNDTQAVVWARFYIKDHSLSNVTWLESVPYGWWYGAELPYGEAIIALGTDPHIAKSMGLQNIQAWAMALSETNMIAPQIYNATIIPDSFRITASHSFLTNKIAGQNWIAIGDAASTFDPLSSAGIYKALSTGRRAAQAIIQSDKTSISSYQQYVSESYVNYTKTKAELYAGEKRWLEHPFWKKRAIIEVA